MNLSKTTVWILGDQLLAAHPALVKVADKQDARVLLIESAARARKLPYQRKKLVLLFSAMRHYAQALRDTGYEFHCVQADDFAARLVQQAAGYFNARLPAITSQPILDARSRDRRMVRMDNG